MRRRDLVTALGVGLFAGCQSDGAEPTDTETDSPTPTLTAVPTPTQTPEAPEPTVETVSLVSQWSEYGDLDANAIDAAAPISGLNLALRYTMPVHDGAIDVMTQMKVLDSDGSRVDMDSETEEILTDDTGVPTWENDLVFDASDWDQGEYTVEAIVRDNVTNKTSGTTTGTFELREPITDVEVVNIDSPNSVQVGEAYQTTLTIENSSGRDGTFESSLSYRTTGDFQRIEGGISLTIPDGQTRDWVSNEITFDNPGEITFRLDETDTKWHVSVEE